MARVRPARVGKVDVAANVFARGAHGFVGMQVDPLEGFSAELAAARITNAELTELRVLQQKMEAAFACRDLPVYYGINARIHDLLSEVAGNPVLSATWGGRTFGAN